ncbi:MAG: tRNA epoxyqueuosine(34) reductase QueG [Bacteroidia bacterium]|nr:tRNA epoxyqueuosine(34) reductase QueG [Bacteroidia bacterium]
MGKTLSEWIKQRAQELGFFSCGIAQAGFLEEEAPKLEKFLQSGSHGKMAYLENHFDKRLNPVLLMEGTQSVISVLHNYYPEPHFHQPEGSPKISVYAWGADYHIVLKNKLHQLAEEIKEKSGGEMAFRVFVDSAPVMDKVWAKKSGLGWVGKHTNLIVPKAGSYFFIGEILCNLKLDYDVPVKDFCGTCTRCIDACPTDALTPYEIDAQKCISYLTIELKEQIPDIFSGQTEGWAYGCDICQEVCPWNRFAKANTGDEFKPLSFILQYSTEDWLNLDKTLFKKLTKESAMSRVKWEKMKENILFSAPGPIKKPGL